MVVNKVQNMCKIYAMHAHDMPLLNIHLQNPTFKSDKRKPSVNKTTPPPLPPPPPNPKKCTKQERLFSTKALLHVGHFTDEFISVFLQHEEPLSAQVWLLFASV